MPTIKREYKDDHMKIINVKKVLEESSSGWLKQKLLKIYFKSPPKIQFALARYVLKDVINKSHQEIEELIRH